MLCYKCWTIVIDFPDMATDNRGVMVYLNPELEKKIEQYCIDNDITRKNKDGAVLPSLGTGILQYLKSQLLSPLPSPVLNGTNSTVLTQAEVLEFNGESNTNLTASNVLTREDVLAIVRAEIDRSLGSPLQGRNLTTTAPTPSEPTNWEEPLSDLISTGMSAREIAIELTNLGFTNARGGEVSRQSVESFLNRRPDFKAIYENARKKGG